MSLISFASQCIDRVHARARSSDPERRDRWRAAAMYIGGRFLRFAGTGEYFLKLGPDSPETLLAYADFDDTIARKQTVPLHTRC